MECKLKKAGNDLKADAAKNIRTLMINKFFVISGNEFALYCMLI